jgi:hypothetical protein
VHAPHPARTDQGELHNVVGHGGQDVSSGGVRYPLPQLVLEDCYNPKRRRSSIGMHSLTTS